jgi:2-polyprenyl-3-methyl-5-hydroxy-6-metoxy-1,4-benzoquinol methylase
MTIASELRAVEEKITSPKEREYFLIHEARYAYILRQINNISKSQSGPVARFLPSDVLANVPALKGQIVHRKHADVLRALDGSPSARATRQNLRVLDVGCFPYHLGAAMELMGYEVWGISSSHEPVKSKKIRTCNIESDRFPFEDNYFDLVVCTEVLEHLPQSPVHALQEIYRVTAPGGHTLITTPNITRSINRAKMILGKSVSYPLHQVMENDGWGSNIYHRHNREYTLKELTTLATLANFSVEKATHFVSYTPTRRRVRPDPLWLKAGKIANYVLMYMLSGSRDTLLVVGRKDETEDNKQ